MKQAKTREVRTSTIPATEIAYWRKNLCDEAVELWMDCYFANEERKALDKMRGGAENVYFENDRNESILMALKLARTQLRAKAKVARGQWALAKLRKVSV